MLIKISMNTKGFTEDYYDREYFAGRKKFIMSDGTVKEWGYDNPDGKWDGCEPIAKAWKVIFSPKKMLDVGAGRGQFIAAARKEGIEAVGFDFSSWAVNDGRYRECRPEWLIQHDATKPWPYADKSFDLVIALDLMEHIYADDIDFVVDEIYRVCSKYVFLEIAVAPKDENGFIIKKGEKPPVDKDPRTWAGHVTVQHKEFWYDKFDRDGILFRPDLAEAFKAIVPNHFIVNWLQNLIMVIEVI